MPLSRNPAVEHACHRQDKHVEFLLNQFFFSRTSTNNFFFILHLYRQRRRARLYLSPSESTFIHLLEGPGKRKGNVSPSSSTRIHSTAGRLSCTPTGHTGFEMTILEKCMESQGLALFGLLSLSYLVATQGWNLLRGIMAHIVSEWWRTDLGKYGGWAVVTGATNGIGKGYAEELARRGFNVVLISRSVDKLKKVAEGIEKETGRQTRVIQADFTRGNELYQSIEEGLKDLDVGILVNNVGMTYSEGAVRFLDVPDVSKAITETLNCNVVSMIQMTRIILPGMVKRKSGLIVNISSEAGSRPYPLITFYSATKVFMEFFSRGLNIEYKQHGITVQCVNPLLVSTNMTRNIKANWYVKTSESYARDSLNTVGYTSHTNGCLSHSLQHYFLHLLFPDFIILSPLCTRFFAMVNKMAEIKQKEKSS